MATEYTNKAVGEDFEIYRNELHVATYDPRTEEVAYTEGNDKYAGPVGREVVKIKAAPPTEAVQPPVETPPVETPPVETPPVETPPANTNVRVTVPEETVESNNLAGVFYTQYCEDVGGKDFNGNPLPTWDEFSSDASKSLQSNAWRSIGVTAINVNKLKQATFGNLNKHITSLQLEVNELKGQLNGETTKRVPDRYKGINFDDPTAPVRDPALGDLTPDFIEWARAGGFTEAQFVQVYTNRIKDLTYPAPEKG